MFLLCFFLLSFILCEDDNSKSELPFEDDDSLNESDTFSSNIDQTRVYHRKRLLDIIRFREILVLLVFIVYIAFYFNGKRSINKYIEKVIDGPLSHLGKFYIAVPKRLVPYSLHKCGTFLTGRATHLGCLLAISLTKRCDIIGYLFDKYYTKAKSTLSFEVIVEQPQNLPIVVHVSEAPPKFIYKMHLLQYTIDDSKLKCYSDFEEAQQYFLPTINEFLKNHPGVLSMLEISDGNRFDLRQENHFVVYAEFNIDGFEDIVFSKDVVDFVMKLSDTYATLKVPRDILERMQRSRKAILDEQKQELEKDHPKSN